MTLQHSVLHSTTGGRDFREWFGWESPGVYTDLASEYRAATEATAVHDASYVGRLKATGADALDLLNRLSTNQVLALEPGQGVPTILTTDRGRILDLIAVINTGEYALLLTSPEGQQRVIDWLDKYTIMEDMTVEDISNQETMLNVLGPTSQRSLEQVVGVDLAGLAPFHTRQLTWQGQPVRIINRPLADLPAFDLILAAESAAGIWSSLVEAGITPMGLDAHEALRVSYGVPIYGREMGEPYNPLEAGLIGSIDFHKGCYIGQEVIARLDTYRKVQKHLVMLRFPNDATVSEGASLEREGQAIGTVTSVASIPTTGELIGLGYVRTAGATVGTRLELAEPASGWAEVAELPQLFGPGEG